MKPDETTQAENANQASTTSTNNLENRIVSENRIVPSAQLIESFLTNPASLASNNFAQKEELHQLLTAAKNPCLGHSRKPISDSPFEEFDRETWASMSIATPLPLTSQDVERLRGLGDPIDLSEVDAIYRPLSGLLQLYVAAKNELLMRQRSFLGEAENTHTPFVIGVAGSVAVGKSSVSRLLKELLSRWPRTPKVELITTDGFLYPNAELIRRNIMQRKGFPESYDRVALLQFLSAVKSGATQVEAPLYSHQIYDIVPGEKQVVSHPDVLIVEGLNVLQPPRVGADMPLALAVSDFFDFSLYLHANPVDIEKWYISRFHQLRATAFTDPSSFFRSLSKIPHDQAEEQARNVWREINLKNLLENIAPTRSRATLIINKGRDHRVCSLQLRKI